MIPTMETALTEDALLGGRLRLLQSRRGYRVAIDAVLLAAAVDAGPGERVLDLGAGVGAVGLCLAARMPGCTFVGIELQPALAELAERNATLNGMGDRVRTIVHDLAQPLPADLGRVRPCGDQPALSGGRGRRSFARSEQGAGDRRIQRRPGALAGGRDRRREPAGTLP